MVVSNKTIVSLVLYAVRRPASIALPPLLFAYVLRVALTIVDLIVNIYKPKLPFLIGEPLLTLLGRCWTCSVLVGGCHWSAVLQVNNSITKQILCL